jgi:hypothetical protein
MAEMSVSDTSELIQAIAAVVSVGFTLALLTSAWFHFKHTRTSSYIERYNSAEFLDIRAKVDQFLYLTEKMSPAERGDVYKHLLLSDHLEDIEFRHQIWTFTMLFNEIGAAWENNAINACLVKNFDRLIPRYWIRLRPYIMNIHLRFCFDLPADRTGFDGSFKLFSSFREAYMRMQSDFGAFHGWRHFLLRIAYYRTPPQKRPKIGIDPRDVASEHLLSEDNHLPLELAMKGMRPQTPHFMGKSVIKKIREDGTWDILRN